MGFHVFQTFYFFFLCNVLCCADLVVLYSTYSTELTPNNSAGRRAMCSSDEEDVTSDENDDYEEMDDSSDNTNDCNTDAQSLGSQPHKIIISSNEDHDD